MSGLQRLSIVVSGVWLAFWLAAYAIDTQPFRWDGFMLFGIAPVVTFVGLPWAVAWVVAGFRPKRAAATASNMNSKPVRERIKQSEAVLHWVHASLDGLKIPALPNSKRVQLAAACWHIAIDHQMAITLLIEQTLHASALALMRPTIEAYVRGVWLLHAASDNELDEAGRDNFPSFFGKIINALEQPGRLAPGALSHMKGDTWKRLCSYTHTGYQQIGARLTSSGLGYQYEDAELLGALGVADSIALMSVIELGGLAGNEPLRAAALQQMRAL